MQFFIYIRSDIVEALMNFKMKIKIFQLFLLFWSGRAFKITMEKECIPPDVDKNAPKCELHMEPASENVQVSCHQNQVIRIVGDFNGTRLITCI